MVMEKWLSAAFPPYTTGIMMGVFLNAASPIDTAGIVMGIWLSVAFPPHSWYSDG